MTRNPALGDWYKAVSTYTLKHYGAPHGVAEWVELGSARLPGPGVLHRQGGSDLKVEVLSSSGCTMLPNGQKICTVFARQMGPVELIRFRLPTGGQGRAMPKRLHRTPSGRLTINPNVLQSVTKVKTAWLPASATGQKPATLRGTWVQLTPGIQGIGLVHAPGMGVQQARVYSVSQDASGRPRAFVRWHQGAHPNASRSRNPGGVRVTTTIASPDKWWCKLLPGARDCIQHKLTQNPRLRAGCTTDADCPGDNCVCRRGVCTTSDPLGCMPGLTARGRRGNPISVAAARATRAPGSGIWTALKKGRASLVLDRRGVKLVAA